MLIEPPALSEVLTHVPKNLTIGLVQQTCGADRPANLAASIEGIRDLASHGAQLVLLQELHANP